MGSADSIDLAELASGPVRAADRLDAEGLRALLVEQIEHAVRRAVDGPANNREDRS